MPNRPDNIIPFKLSFEFLELMASAHAPAGGAVLWRHEDKLRLVRHESEPLTVGFCYDLMSKPRREEIIGVLPRTVEAVYDSDTFTHLPTVSIPACCDAIVKSMQADAIDYSPLCKRKKQTR